ncbi:MAG: PQQ-dependent sugar dehydrogenase [Planctomycetaceae bacterium]|nr:PQQ-dependent sugar dehydrogenase [Planctomycetaceae bacterium]
MSCRKTWLRQLLLSVRLGCVVPFLTVAGADDTPRIKEYERFALTHAGNATRGQELFRDPQRTRCATCHRVEGQGGDVGPNLTSIGGKFDRPHLIESLLEPSRQIVEGYRTTVITLTDGRVLAGIVRDPDDQSLTLFGADAKRTEVATGDVDTRTESGVSIMPEGLTRQLSREQFTDLVAYLETLRSGPEKMGAGISGPVQLPPGFEVDTIATGLTGATALETVSDGRILICEQTGTLRVIRDGQLLPEPLISLPVTADWERGLIGVTVDPDFPQSPYVYVCYVAAEPYPHHVVSRIVANGDVARPGSEQILLEGDDQRHLGGKVPSGHQGGALHFGPDRCLYVAIGEQTAETPAQKLDTLLGKILRIHPDGSIPEDNPFYSRATGKYRAIWALGCRNPYTFAFRSGSDEMLINDVGGRFEEINRGAAGANFGWPAADHGPVKDQRFTGPLCWYPQSSICGGDFVPVGRGWPAEFEGTYLFADFVHGWIHALAADGQVRDFASGLRRPVDLRFDAQGALCVLLRNAWVMDGKFAPATSSLLRIRPSDSIRQTDEASATSSNH